MGITFPYASKRFLFFAILMVVFLQPSGSRASPGTTDHFFPQPGFYAGWVLDGAVKYYDREDLFDYINGEAELFYPFGFKRLASGFYRKSADPKIGLTVDVYEMGSLLEAFGIYAHFRRNDSQLVRIGSEGFVSPSQLMFYQQRFFVQLSASGTSVLERPLLEACARMIAKKLPGRSLRPKELSWLDHEFVSPGTVQYVPQSLLGHPFLRRGLTARGLLGGKELRIFLVWEDSPEKAQKALDGYFRHLKDAGGSPRVTATQEKISLSGADPLYKTAAMALKGRFLVGVVDLDRPEEGDPIVEKLLSRLPQ